MKIVLGFLCVVLFTAIASFIYVYNDSQEDEVH